MPDNGTERALRQLGGDILYPETPAFGGWSEHLPDVPSRRAPARRSVAVAGAVAAALIVVLAIPGPRAAIARLFGIGAVSVTVVEELPEIPLSRDPSGAPVELLVARELVEFELLTLAAPPDVVFLDQDIPGGMVTLGYTGPDGFKTMITQLQADTDAAALGKLVAAGTVVREVDVAGEDGFWIEGDPHVLVLFDRDGTVVEDSARLAGNTLLFVRDGVTVRIEGGFDLDQALQVAEELSA